MGTPVNGQLSNMLSQISLMLLKRNHSGLSKIGNSSSRRETTDTMTNKLIRPCSLRENQLESHQRVPLLKLLLPKPLSLRLLKLMLLRVYEIIEIHLNQ